MNNASHSELTTATAGEEVVTASQLELHRAALMGHCYRMLGSAAEAEDAVQETMVRAWRSLSQLVGRASLRAWLYRIATRVCLDVLAEPRFRTRPVHIGTAGSLESELVSLPGSRFVEPIPDVLALPAATDPEQHALLRQSIRLAFVAALQHLPPRQRAVLLMSEVLGFSCAEIADSLEVSVAAVNSALQRARATLSARELGELSAPLPEPQAALLTQFVDAFERYDQDALAKLLHRDATLSMPPYSLWLRGHADIRSWLLGPGIGCRGSRLLPTSASGLPAFGQYRPSGSAGSFAAWALIVLEYSGDKIASLCSFLDVAEVFPRFGLPLTLPS